VFPDIESFLELRRKENRFEAFFLKYENHVRFHKSDEADHFDPDCGICELEKLSS
jgi:hypothetical protein